jgi:Spy/CpxP family protein refolding chaperone
MEHVLKTRLMTAVVIAAVFGSGVLIGFAADNTLGSDVVEASAVEADSARAEAPRRRPMYTRVNPTEPQLASIDSIVRTHRKRINALDDERRAAVRQITLETRAEIMAVLNPEQAERYREILANWDARQAAERARGNGDGDG